MSDPDLPSRLPIFPLPNVVLFPGVPLPLHVFEPRYRQMTTDAIEGAGLIGMSLIRPGESPMQSRAPVFDVGCAGRMTRVSALPDGRYAFVLVGLRRFRIARELDVERLYRVIEPEWLPEPDLAALEPDEQTALEGAAEHLRLQMLELARLAVPDQVESLRQQMARLDPLQLSAQLAFGLDCGVVEKQGLLESEPGPARVELLIRLVEMRRAERAAAAGSRSLN